MLVPGVSRTSCHCTGLVPSRRLHAYSMLRFLLTFCAGAAALGPPILGFRAVVPDLPGDPAVPGGVCPLPPFPTGQQYLRYCAITPSGQATGPAPDIETATRQALFWLNTRLLPRLRLTSRYRHRKL